jgi:GWxTD domain-containing protein
MLSTTYRVWLNQDVAYIIGDEERSAYLRLQTDNQREQFIENFWLQRGQQFRADHYHRMDYANEHFTTGVPGWKTDRGRIYIKYGPPDQIDDHGKLQDWTYRFIPGIGSNVMVEFENDGSGEFRMTKEPAAKEDPQPEAAAKAVASPSQETPKVSVEPLTERGFLVTVSVPLANTGDAFHVMGRITRNQKTVGTFENDTSGGRKAASSDVRLKPGAYHLTTLVKNMASGVTETSELDFTVQ